MKAKIDFNLYEENAPRWEQLDPMIDTAHTLIAGRTGCGKSTLLHSIIWSIMSAPSYFMFIDVKRVELRMFEKYQGCAAYIDDPSEVHKGLTEVIMEMEERYEKMQKEGKYRYEGVPFFVVIDELAALVKNKKILGDLVEIGRLGRAANIHLICATQDPSRQTLSAQLMQNMTCCVAMQCKTATESRQIIGFAGAEDLPKHGTVLMYNEDGLSKVRVPLTTDEQIAERVKKYERWFDKEEKPTPKEGSVFDWKELYLKLVNEG